jgi:oligopeptide/dipeptide ABC transporter ATP-binding protein
MILALAALAILGPIIWGIEAEKISIVDAYQAPSSAHLLGTDRLGRDVLARVLAATRLTLELGFAAAGISVVVGFGIGVAVSAMRPRLRGLGRRVIEATMSFPPMLLALFLVTIIGTGAQGAVIAIGLGAAPSFARLAENYATSIYSKEYIVSARAAGIGRWRLITRYLLPNMAEPLVLAGFAYVAGAIIDISGLAFLGLGVQPPLYDWGTLLTSGVLSFYVTPLASLAPAIMITVAGMSLVYFGEALSRALNPRLWVADGRRSPSSLASAKCAMPITGSQISAPAVTQDGAVLVVEGLTISQPNESGQRALVDDLSFHLQPGEVLGIVGETGSGKTLTSLSIGGLLPHPLRMRTRRMELDGIDLTAIGARRLRRVLGTRLAMIFQDPMSSLNPAARVGSQLIDGACAHRLLPRRAARAEAIMRLKEVGISDAQMALRRYPHQFSGGMQQRIMIAMGLMAHPRVLIADEPTTALDVIVQAQVLEVLREVRKREDTAIILISHNLGVINQICDRVLVMYAGRVVEEGSRDHILRSALHPYTKALLAATPDISTQGGQDLQAIPGRPPLPDEIVCGCAFVDRCPMAIDRCRAERPELVAINSDNNRVACFVAITALEKGAL